MLRHLHVKDIVLIEEAQLEFADGLCVLTGETGAGKSILLDALGLVLGSRAEARLVRAGKEQGSVVAEFDAASHPAIPALLEELGITHENGELVLRRVLTTDGKTRCFINDQTVSVGALKQLGEMLVEIYGQHDQRGLLDPSSHRELLDEFAGLAKPRAKVEAAYTDWTRSRGELEAVLAEIAAAKREEEYLRHIFTELESFSPEAGEEEKLAEKRQWMMQGEKARETLAASLQELQGEHSVGASLRAAARMLARSPAAAGDRFAKVLEALERAEVEVNEAEAELERLIIESDYNPAELEKLEERLFGLRGLARKHQVTVDELANLLEETRRKLATLDGQTQSVAALEKAVETTRAAFVKEATALCAARAKAAQVLEKAIMAELGGLKMAGTRFTVQLEKLEEQNWHSHGMDRVTYLAATNAGNPPAPLAKIASGGELSRFMLAMKVAMADLRSASTLIFDEIDTGTGGATADAIGKRLAKLGKRQQVLVVTHLPQVAACGSHHLRVSKSSAKGSTRTKVEALDETTRREEVARMLAGATVTDEARAAADKLMAAE